MVLPSKRTTFPVAILAESNLDCLCVLPGRHFPGLAFSSLFVTNIMADAWTDVDWQGWSGSGGGWSANDDGWQRACTEMQFYFSQEIPVLRERVKQLEGNEEHTPPYVETSRRANAAGHLDASAAHHATEHAQPP